MENINVFNLFWIVNGILLLFLMTVCIIMTNRKILKKRGYEDKYIEFMRKDYLRRSLGMAVVIPVLELAAYYFVNLFVEDVRDHYEIILIVFVILIIPFPFIDHYITKKKVNELLKQTGSSVVIDIKYKTLNLVFNPILEIVLSLLVVVYMVWIIKPMIVFYLHIVLPWIFYYTARGAKKAVRPQLRDGYVWAFVFIVINFILVIYYIISGLIDCLHCYSAAAISMGILIACVLTARILLYLIRYPEFRRRLDTPVKY